MAEIFLIGTAKNINTYIQPNNNLTTTHSPIKCTVKGIYESLNHHHCLVTDLPLFYCFKHLEKHKNCLYFIYCTFYLVIYEKTTTTKKKQQQKTAKKTNNKHLSQFTTKPTRRLIQPAKTQNSLCIRTV